MNDLERMRDQHATRCCQHVARILTPVIAGARITPGRVLAEGELTIVDCQLTLSAMAPVVDIQAADIMPAMIDAPSRAGLVAVPLRHDNGVNAVNLLVRWAAGQVVLEGFEGQAPRVDEGASLADLRSDGRLPRNLWVGSPALRLERLLNAVPHGTPLHQLPEAQAQLRALVRGDALIRAEGMLLFYKADASCAYLPQLARAVGAVQRASIIESANAMLDEVDLHDETSRLRGLSEMSRSQKNKLLRFAARYRQIAAEPLTDLVAAYVAANRGDYLV